MPDRLSAPILAGLALAAMLASGLASAAQAQAPAANVVPLTARTPHHGFNRLVVTITVCAPGTSRCARIEDVMVDTGSTGLRIEASALPPGLDAPAFTGPDGRQLAECLRYLHDVSWGRLHRLDLRLGGLVAADLPVQIVDSHAPDLPAGCPRSDVRATSNGTLGIGPLLTDCAGVCEQSPERPGVFACDAAACAPVEGRVAPPYRLPNPVSRLPGHDNGIVVELPPAPPGGAGEVTGTLTFGIGTAADNRLGASAIVRTDGLGRFATLYGVRFLPDSYIDSGTPTLILPDDTLPRCDGMEWAFCAVPEIRRAATIVGRDGTASPVAFGIGSFRAFLDSGFGASGNVALVAEPSSKTFVWGAPFFLGRRVSVLIQGRSVPGAEDIVGPLYAFEASGLR